VHLPPKTVANCAGLFTAFFAFVLVLPASAGETTWKVEPIDSPRGFGSLTHDSLAADRDGGLHLAYGGRHLYYAYRQNAGSAWLFETADDAPNVGSGAAIVIDDVGRPHISYCDGISGGVRYAHRDGFGWQVEIVYAPPKPQGSAALGDSAPDTEALEATPAGPGDSNCSTSVAIGRDGRAHIAFHPTPPANSLEYAYRDATGWHVSVRDDGAFAGSEPSPTTRLTPAT
jgi:hypothetical protein